MQTNASVRNTVGIQPIGGSTAVIEMGGLRLVTDPTFDEPHASAPGRPQRTSAPALAAQDLGHLDVALVSHDQHPDNLDQAGRALLGDIPLVLTTVGGAQRLGGSARGLQPFESIEVERRDGRALRVTALPAQHGPIGAEAESGPVVGFLVAGDGLPTVYVSGDNASVDVVRDIVARVGTVDVALLFVGAARAPFLFDGAPLTLTSEDAVQAARVLGARVVVPIHCDGWTHYSEDCHAVVRAFAAAGLGDVLRVVPAGEAVSL
jgi:L-ascorbate metabolism protein UlaG (beta-lactamase superfamily)